MTAMTFSHTPERAALVRWTARIGAVTARSLADHDGITVTAARARLQGAERLGLLRRTRPLTDRPSLFTATRTGIRVAGLAGVEPSRVSAANATHALACAEVAVALELAYRDHVVSGERELRRDERAFGEPLASAYLSGGPAHARLHRPDLVMWPSTPAGGLPIAVEVELSAKAPLRLRQICIAWGRCTCVAGVLYVAAPEAHRVLGRAIVQAHAEGRIAIVSLEAIAGPAADASESPIAGAA